MLAFGNLVTSSGTPPSVKNQLGQWPFLDKNPLFNPALRHNKGLIVAKKPLLILTSRSALQKSVSETRLWSEMHGPDRHVWRLGVQCTRRHVSNSWLKNQTVLESGLGTAGGYVVAIKMAAWIEGAFSLAKRGEWRFPQAWAQVFGRSTKTNHFPSHHANVGGLQFETKSAWCHFSSG